MSCDCIEKVENLVEEHLKENNPFKKPVEKVRMPVAFSMDGSHRTYTDMQVHLEGQVKTKSYTLVHSFCPICGERIEKSEGEHAS